MNASIAAENIALQNDNKQLNALIREYESTLETLMDQFRNRAVRPISALSFTGPDVVHSTKSKSTSYHLSETSSHSC